MMVGGSYRLDRLLARGGMGAVWAGWDTSLDRPVAIKFMDVRIGASSDLRARFEREAKAVARIRSPHVVQIYGHGVDGERPYIVMELLEGEDLGSRIKRERRLGVAFTARVLTQASKALRRAHEAGIVHRDLKPQNIFLAHVDDDEMVKILDFGIAKRFDGGVDGESTRTGELLGSPHYMSPEQARGLREIDHRSDLWSLGVIAFRALTGELPFRGEAVGDIIYKICSAQLPVASQLRPELPARVDAFFQRALAREPAERFQTASELAVTFVEAVGVDAEISVRLLAGAVTAPRSDRAAQAPVADESSPPSYPSVPSVSMAGAYAQPSAVPPAAPVAGKRLPIVWAAALVGGALVAITAFLVLRSTERPAPPAESEVRALAPAVVETPSAASPAAPAASSAADIVAPPPTAATAAAAASATSRASSPSTPAKKKGGDPAAKPTSKKKNEWGY